MSIYTIRHAILEDNLSEFCRLAKKENLKLHLDSFLYLAVQTPKESINILKKLISKNMSYVPIRLAVMLDNLEIVKILYPYASDLDLKTSLDTASTFGYLDIIKYLVEMGISTNLALRKAIQYNHIEVVKYLLRLGIQVDSDLVYISILNNNHEIVNQLLPYIQIPKYFYNSITDIKMLALVYSHDQRSEYLTSEEKLYIQDYFKNISGVLVLDNWSIFK